MNPRSHSRRNPLTAVALVAVALVVLACAPANPLVKLREQLERYPQYSVILQDMKVDGNFGPEYFHKYRVVTGEPLDELADSQGVTEADVGLETLQPGDTNFADDLSDWERVSKDVYRQYQPYLGMVILSKDENGQVTSAQYPPGYQYVGDTRYGRWRSDSSGGSFWEFYGKYALMSHLFGSFNRPVYRSDWDSYNTSRQRGQPYFGRNKEFGTRGSYTRTSNPTFFERQKVRQSRSQDRFARKVRDRAGRSQMSRTRTRSSGRRGGK